MAVAIPSFTLALAGHVDAGERVGEILGHAHQANVTAGHVRGKVILDPEVSLVKRLMAAFWQVCGQELATVTDPEVGGTMFTPP